MTEVDLVLVLVAFVVLLIVALILCNVATSRGDKGQSPAEKKNINRNRHRNMNKNRDKRKHRDKYRTLEEAQQINNNNDDDDEDVDDDVNDNNNHQSLCRLDNSNHDWNFSPRGRSQLWHEWNRKIAQKRAGQVEQGEEEAEEAEEEEMEEEEDKQVRRFLIVDGSPIKNVKSIKSGRVFKSMPNIHTFCRREGKDAVEKEVGKGRERGGGRGGRRQEVHGNPLPLYSYETSNFRLKHSALLY